MKANIAIAVYLLGVIFTYGFVHNDLEKSCRGFQCDMNSMVAFYTAMVWPAYWPLHLSGKAFEHE